MGRRHRPVRGVRPSAGLGAPQVEALHERLLENLRAALRSQLPGQSAELLTLDKTVANLLRMWAHP